MLQDSCGYGVRPGTFVCVQLNAPLMDNSPFPLDDNLDTTNIMEEAARMAQELGGATQARGMMHPAASPMTPTGKTDS